MWAGGWEQSESRGDDQDQTDVTGDWLIPSVWSVLCLGGIEQAEII